MLQDERSVSAKYRYSATDALNMDTDEAICLEIYFQCHSCK